jgi:hypothetical protein
VCCGTKRLVEIRCPADCAYLASSREHPAAVTIRRQQRDIEALLRAVRDLNDRQSELFYVVAIFLLRYQSPQLQPLVDDDVMEAVSALAGTFETAVRGVIYEHQAASAPANRLAAALKAAIEGARPSTTASDRDAAVVLRRFEQAVREMRTVDRSGRAFLDLLARTIKPPDADAAAGAAPSEGPRLIVP